MLRLLIVFLLWPITIFASERTNYDPSYFLNNDVPRGFERLTTEQGLSNNYIWSMLQDHKGRLWIGTADGLNVYDGYRFKVIKHDPADPNSIPPSEILALLEDSDGYLWLGLSSGVFVRYDPVMNRAITFSTPETRLGLNGEFPLRFLQSRDRTIWIATTKGLFYYKSAVRQVRLALNEQFTAIMEEPDGRLMLSSKEHICVFNPKSGKIEERYPADKYVRDTDDIIKILYKDSRGRIWVGTNASGLFLFDKQKGFYKHYNFDSQHNVYGITGILEWKDGMLWIATSPKGLYLFEPESGNYTRYYNIPYQYDSLSADVVRSLLIDRSGVLWIGTESGGLNKYSIYRNKFRVYRSDFSNPNRLGNNFVRGICVDREGQIWVATQGGGLSRYNRITDQSRIWRRNSKDHNSLPSDHVMDVLEDSKGRIWVTTGRNGSLSLIDRSGRVKNYTDSRYGLFDDMYNKLAEDSQGRIWMGGNRAFYCFDPETESFKTFRYRQEIILVQVIYQSRDGFIWIGTAALGLLKLDPQSETIVANFTHDATNPQSLSSSFVTFIGEDKNGRLLVATKGGGLNICIDRERGIFKHIQQKDGLPHQNIYACLQDEAGYYWISSDNGICRYDSKSQKFIYFNVADGLQDKEFNRFAFHQTAQGEIFFGGINGFNSFFPSRVAFNVTPPKIIFTDLIRKNEYVALTPDISYRKELEFNYSENSFSIEFSLLDFDDPKRNTYEYKLEGMYSDWMNADASNRLATYTNIPPGVYNFHVRGCNSDGACDHVGETLRIRIWPPWWRTWWAYTLFTFTALGVIWGGVKLRVSYLEHIVAKRTAEIVRQRKEIETINSQILDSIHYAERIQQATLPYKGDIESVLGHCFIIYRPKDIVSGDFYWFYRSDSLAILAVVDCTGHGVPGALMSMVADQLLNQVVVERRIVDPAEILMQMHLSIRQAFKQDEPGASQDSLDIALCVFDLDGREIGFAGARCSLYYLDTSGQVNEVKGNRRSVGGGGQRESRRFYTTNALPMSEISRIYLTTDGLVDQPNNEGKKFGKHKLLSLLLSTSALPIEEQGRQVLEELLLHQKSELQRDDITILGLDLSCRRAGEDLQEYS